MNITIDLDIKKIPLEDFMQAIGCQPINRLGNLIVYKPPYVKDAKPTFIINKTKNQWTDTTTGAKGGIYELAYKLIGTANMSELNMYIAGEMTALRNINDKHIPTMKEIIISGISGNHEQVESQLAKILENAEIELKDNLLIDIYYNGIASRGMTRYNMSVSYMDETKEWSSRVPDIISEEMTLNDNSDEIEVTEACQSFVDGMINEYKTAIIDFVSNVNSLHTHIKPKNKMKLSF